MGFVIKIMKKVISKMDLFSSIQLLRFDGDADTKTFTGGIISFALVVYLISTFSTMVLNTFNKLIITAYQDTTQPHEPQPIYLSTTDNAQNFMIGVEVSGFDLNTGSRYFDVIMRNSFRKSFMVDGQEDPDSVVYDLQPCTLNHWQSLPNISATFDKINMNRWLCMPVNATPVLMGKYSSDLQTTFDIEVKKCNNQTDPNRQCAPQQQIDAFLIDKGPFYFSFFFINPQINPQSHDYLSLYLQDKYYTMFGVDFGMQMYLDTAGYQITTDESILPYSASHRQNGSVVTSVFNNAYNIKNPNNSYYSYISFQRAAATLIVGRSYQKILDAFSFVGGLLGSFLLALIFINFYNECSYEMRFALTYFPEKDCPTSTKKFHIGYYFLQSVYSLLRLLKVKCEKWQAVKYFHKTREEMQRQLDVKYLFKKLHILENAMMLLLTKPQLKGLMLQHEMTVTEAKKMRRVYGLKSKIKKLYRNKSKEGTQEPINKRQSKIITTSDIMQENKKRFDSSVVQQLSENNYNTLNKNAIQLSSSESGESSDSSAEQQTFEAYSQKCIEDLRQLKEQAQQNNAMSQNILKNLDPFIKHIYQGYISHQKEMSFSKNVEKRGDFTTKYFIELNQTKVAPKAEQTQSNLRDKKQQQLRCFTFIQD